ncbi:hypothetical protein G9A89_023287 [Geosiphon pyriformis]|nr:hypothetical protein G9A89_023287 [Geosiphon pyriformis]
MVVRNLFSKVNGFGGVSTPTKSSRIIHVFFTSESSLAQTTEKARVANILVNTNLKKLFSHSDRAVMVKEIPVRTLAKAVHAVLTEFGSVVSIKIQLVELWQKAVVEFAQSDQANLVAAKWFILIGKDAVRARCTVVCFDSAASINAVIKTTPVLKGANLHWSYMSSAKCAKCENLGYISLDCSVNRKVSSGGTTCRILLNDDKSRLASIYARCSAPISHLVSFGGVSWANIVGGSSFPFLSVCYGLAAFGFSSKMKLNLMVSIELNDRFAALECSLTSLMECIDKLAKRLNLPEPMVFQPSLRYQLLVTSSSQNQEVDIVMSENLGVVTSGETIVEVAVFDSSVVSKMEKTLRNLSITVMGLLAKINNAGLIMKKFDGVCIFTSGLVDGYFGTGVEEISGHVILVHLLFKGKVLVSIIGLYTCAFSGDHNFIVLESDFNKDKSIRSASFRFCLSIDLVNFFGIEKVINYVFVSESLISAVANHRVESVAEFFDTDHRAILVSVDLGGLLDMCLAGIYKHANMNCWKFKLKNVDTNNWRHFMECSSEKFLMKSAVFHDAEHDKVLRKITIDSANAIFSKIWYCKFDNTRNKTSSKFYGLELLMSKIVKSMKTGLSLKTNHLVNTWVDLDNDKASKIRAIINEDTRIMDIVHHISVVKKEYHKSKYHELKVVRDESIRAAVVKHMKNFCSDKGKMIKSILDQSFRKVVLNHLVVDRELILEPQTVKSSVDTIIEDWTKKHLVFDILPARWLDQYTLLEYIADNTFSKIMCNISLDKLLVIVKELSDGKAAGLSEIPNKLWKHSGSLVLNGLLSILNRCLKSGSVSTQWRKSWVFIIPKLYNWEGTLTNTRPIALVETTQKILFKILLDKISLVYSRCDVLHDNNFLVLKDTST